jgi:hypothetical protein
MRMRGIVPFAMAAWCVVLAGCPALLSDDFRIVGGATPLGDDAGDGPTNDSADGPKGDDGSVMADGVSDVPTELNGSDGSVDSDAGSDSGCMNNETLCNQMCVDLQTNSTNCGACGHDCLGATCTAALCQPTVLAPSQNGPTVITVDATNVYWVNLNVGTVMKVPIAGGSTTQLASGVQNATSIEVDATNVYWSDINAGTVNKVPIGGGSVTPLATGYQPKGIAVIGGYVYFTDFNGGSNSHIYSVPTGGGSVQPVAAAGGGPDPIAADGLNVYWSSQVGCTNQSPVYQAAIDSGSVTVLATMQGCPRSIAIDSSYVYWTESVGGNLRRVPIDGGSVSLLVPGGAGAVVVDTSYAYFNANGDIVKMLKTGGATTTVVSGQSPAALAVDGTYLYWTAGGNVSKVAK